MSYNDGMKEITPITDRRIRRTMTALRRAMLALQAEKGYDAVTVQDIVNRADVGRSTFYTHFADKQDLVRVGVEQLGARLYESAARDGDPARRPFAFSMGLFRHALSQRAVYHTLSRQTGGHLIRQWFGEMALGLITDELTALRHGQPDSRTPLDGTARFLTGALMALLVGVLDGDLPYDANQADAVFRRLADAVVREVLPPG